jgi:hypothetical protein
MKLKLLDVTLNLGSWTAPSFEAAKSVITDPAFLLTLINPPVPPRGYNETRTTLDVIVSDNSGPEFKRAILQIEPSWTARNFSAMSEESILAYPLCRTCVVLARETVQARNLCREKCANRPLLFGFLGSLARHHSDPPVEPSVVVRRPVE